MNLYANLDLEREPFSNTPDPSFLHETRQHASCLQELEISLRLRRGLNVITGDIGTGKTTLCRGLLRAFAEDKDADLHLLLDPHFDTQEEFLRVVLGSVSRLTPDPSMGVWELKEALKQQLFRLGMVERRLVVLIIDEGQKISAENLELLREMLNYETNSSKLLQIVLFAQRELEPLLEDMPNLVDRINVRRRLLPLSLSETREMIRHRLRVAAGGGAPQVSFTPAAIWSIHRASGGSPRKIVRLCHMAMLEMLVRGKTRVGLAEARAAKNPGEAARSRTGRALGAAMGLCLVFGALWLSMSPSGPVLGPAQVAATAPAAPGRAAPGQAAPAAALREPQVRDAEPAARQAQADPTAPGRPSARATELSAQGLTLQPDQDEAQAAPAGLTLQPARDQGPAVRGPIVDQAPGRLHAEAGDPTGQAEGRGGMLSGRMARTVAMNMIGR